MMAKEGSVVVTAVGMELTLTSSHVVGKQTNPGIVSGMVAKKKPIINRWLFKKQSLVGGVWKGCVCVG